MSASRALHTRNLEQRLFEAEATIAALLSGQIDAVVDTKSNTPVLLAKAQEALGNSEECYRRIVETTNEGICTSDAQSEITFANLRLAEMLGYPLAEILGKPLWRFLLRAAEGNATLRLVSGRQELSEENEVGFVRGDGSELWALVKTSPIRDSVGNCVGTLAMLTDRTRHKRAEEALRKTEEQYRQIVEATSDGIVKSDARAQVVFANQRFAQMLGYQPREMLGMSIFLFMSDAAKRLAADSIRSRRSKSDGLDTTLRHKDGSDVSVDISSTVLMDENGRYAGNLAVVRDVTERKELQAQLMLSDRMASVGTLAAGVAHEINNPLAAVLANLECMNESLRDLVGGDDSPARLSEVQEALNDAREAGRRVRVIVRDLGVFSRSPSQEPKCAVDVRTVMDASARMAWNEIRHRARLVKHYDSVPDVEANEARLGQVFLNLLVNAAQALEEGRAEQNEIHVSTRLDGEQVIVEVSDTGPGIAPEVVCRIFEPFFTTKAPGLGTGLGLAICQRIVTEMSGRLTVKSEPGTGSIFRVTLPVSRGAETAVATLVEQPPVASRRGRVLVVDDEKLVAQVVQRILSEEHDVATTLAAGDALARCASGEEFDLILCDLMMPNMNGMDLHRELSLIAPEQARRMIFMTGGVFTEGARNFLTQAQREHLEKPFEPSSLRALVQRHLK